MQKFITLHLTEGHEPIRLNTDEIHKYRKHLTDDGSEMTRIELKSFKDNKEGSYEHGRKSKRQREAIIVDMDVKHIDELMKGLWTPTQS